MDKIVINGKSVLRVKVELEFRAGTLKEDALEEALEFCVVNKQNVWFSFNAEKYYLVYDNLFDAFNVPAKR